MKDIVWETKKLADITPASYNPRSISKEALAGLTSSITRFGLVEPIVWNKQTGNIVGGHQRFKVLTAQGVEETTVVVVDMPENEEIALNVTLNNPAIQGDWTDNIGDLLERVEGELPELYKSVMLNDLGKMFPGEDKKGHTDPDAIPVVPKTPESKEGEVYRLGDHRLMCGSSTKEDDVKKLMNGELVSLWLTDPPYNVAYVGKTKDALKIANDKMSDDDFLQFLTSAYKAADSVMKPGAVYYIWYSDSETLNFFLAMKSCGWDNRQVLIWNKNTMVLGWSNYQQKHEPCLYGHKLGGEVTWNGDKVADESQVPEQDKSKKGYEPEYDPCLYGWKEGAAHCWNGGRKMTTVFDYKKPARSADHPTTKPVELFTQQMKNSSNEGDVVFDSFCGSGTTIMAAEITGRLGRGMELSTKYCDVIRKRWTEYVHGEGCDWQQLTPIVGATE